ncbi:PSB2 [Enterospora canceri]|uniref:Proteasome subunit beta n=1 Tax=Enterospora canceri TaxID=1081671 RepID=A0A1Y1S995_9MICR|nr:PSB2 [Enterospora canceri]
MTQTEQDATKQFDLKYGSRLTKTGTTIVGVKYKTGVVLCADTRSTNGPIVADKNCRKIHYISEKIMCCGAGTSADTGRVTRMAFKELSLFKHKYLKQPYVTHAKRLIEDYLLRYGGHIVAALVLGGIDDTNGPMLISISPDGNSSDLDYATMGSGSFAATGVLELNYKKNMSVEEATELGKNAIKAGILNDLYSGSNVDVFIIDEKYTKDYKSYEVVAKKLNNMDITYPKDSIKITKEEVFKYIEEV